MFTSKNELNQFDFSDCELIGFDNENGRIKMILESLIVLENNSQNTNYTKSYAATAEMTLADSSITSVIIAGYKIYDANDNVIEEIADKTVEAKDYPALFDRLAGTYLYRCIKVSDDDGYEYDFEVESVEDGDMNNLRNDTFVIRIRFSDCTVTWDRYLNRVEG